MNKNLKLEDIEDWLINKCAEIKEVAPDKIKLDRAFASYDMGSLEITQVSGELEDWLKIKINPTILFEYSTIEKLSNYLIAEINKD